MKGESRMPTNPKTVTLGEVRLSYVNVWEPQARPGTADEKYSVTILLPKSNTAAKAALDAAVAAAIEAGVSSKWNGVRPPQIAICVHDGDGPRPSDGQPFGEECRGMWVFTASSKQQPFIVDANVQPIINKADVYSGCWGRVNVTFFAYNNNGRKGIGCALNGLQKLRDDEPLAGRITAEEAFGAPQAAYAQPQATPYGAYGQSANPFAVPQYNNPPF